MHQGKVGVEWIVAVLAPWSVSPHPNFSQPFPGHYSRLALVTEMRDEKAGAAFGEEGLAPGEGWEMAFVDSARKSLDSSTQIEAIDSLSNIVINRTALPGARAAALLYQTVALCENDRHDEAITEILRLIDELLPNLEDVSKTTPSGRIILSALGVQLVFRLTESCRFEEALNFAFQVKDWLPRLDETKLDSFPVSKGINWGAAAVQRDVIRSIRMHLNSLRAQLEYMHSNVWADVVKGRSSWVDHRMDLCSASRDELVLRDAFEDKIDAKSTVRHFVRNSPEIAGYRSLLIGELSGRLGFVRASRERLGKVILLEYSGNEERSREAIRLLRQSGSVKSLRSGLSWLRGEGPTEAIVAEAAQVIDKVHRMKWCTEHDLLVLESAADFLTEQQCDSAIEAARQYLSTPQLSGAISSASKQRFWKVVSRLLPLSTKHAELADLAYQVVSGVDGVDQPLGNTLSLFVSAVDWYRVPIRLVHNWEDWLGRQEDSEEYRELKAAVRRYIVGSEGSELDKFDLSDVVSYLERDEPKDINKTTVSRLSGYLIEAISDEQAQAHRRSIAFGSYSRADLATAFAFRHNLPELWDSILNYMTDSAVFAVLKSSAIDRMARYSTDLPSSVSKLLSDRIRSIMDSDRRDALFSDAPSVGFAPSVRLAGALNAVPVGELLKVVVELAASHVKDRIDAAKTIPYCLGSDIDGNWAHVLLLQLSYDSNPDVRAAAGSSLIEGLFWGSDLAELAKSRVVELIGGDGVRVPLQILHSIQFVSTQAGKEFDPEVVRAVEKVAEREPNRIVRGAAEIALERIRG